MTGHRRHDRHARRRHDLRPRRHAGRRTTWPPGSRAASKPPVCTVKAIGRGVSVFLERAPQHLADHRLRQLGAELDRATAPCTARAARGRTRAAPASVAVCPARSTTHALTASPLTSSATPATPTSATAGCAASTSSTSRGHTWIAARLDQVLLAIDDEEVAVLVEVAEVAGVQPAPRAVRRRRARAARRRFRSGRFQ